MMKRVLGGTVAAALLLGILAPSPARADREEAAPRDFQGVGMVDRRGEFLPLATAFRDEQGEQVALSQLFDGKRPVILTLVYFRCPMLCGLVLNGLLDGLKQMKWTAGQEFQVVTISFDPSETPPLARAKKQNMIQEYGRPEAARGWHFLTGTKASIELVTQAVGFHYRWVEEQNQYAHPSGIFVCSPSGQLTHFQDGIRFDAADLKRDLTEAADGKIGSWLDRFGWVCLHVVDTDNPGALVMRIFGVIVLIAVIVFLLLVRRSSKRKGRVQAPAPS